MGKLYTSLILFVCITFSSCDDHITDVEKSSSSTNLHTNQTIKQHSATLQNGPALRYDDMADAGSFTTDGRSWNDNNITYYFESGTSDISDTAEYIALREAMNLWEEYSQLTFAEVNDRSYADIVFRWEVGDHGDGSAFDGQDGVLAHAFFPPPNGGDLAGDVHFDDAENWTDNYRSVGGQPIDLITVAAHELGHSLGLGHSSDQNALMYAYYFKSHRYLSDDDIAGIQELYGVPAEDPTGPLAVAINGPTYLETYDSEQWTADPSGGDLPYSYQWEYLVMCRDSYSTALAPPPPPGGGGDSCDGGTWKSGSQTDSFLFTHSSKYSDMYLRVTISDGSNNSITEEIRVTFE